MLYIVPFLFHFSPLSILTSLSFFNKNLKDCFENNPITPSPLEGEGGGEGGALPWPPPPQSSPIKGEDNNWQFSLFEGDVAVMKHYIKNKWLRISDTGHSCINRNPGIKKFIIFVKKTGFPPARE
jgi:hypothetical protein